MRAGTCARTAPGAGARAGRGPETGGSGAGAGNWATKNGAQYPGRNPRKLIPGPALPFFPPRLFFEIDSTSTTLTIRQATPEDSGKYEVYVENSLGMDHPSLAWMWPERDPQTCRPGRSPGRVGQTTLLHLA